MTNKTIKDRVSNEISARFEFQYRKLEFNYFQSVHITMFVRNQGGTS